LGADTPAKDSAAGLLRAALAAGIRYIDTAAAYGDAEAIVGLVADDVISREARVCTKIAPVDARSAGVTSAIRASLSRLRRPAVDTVMLHSVTGDVLTDMTLGASMRRAVDEGLASKVGVSTYGVTDARAAIALPWCGAIQLEHSILNPSVLNGVDQRPRSVEVVARSVLCKGLLTRRRAFAGDLAAGLSSTLASLDSLAQDLGLELPALAIRFALDTPGVDIVLVGVSDEAELELALRAASSRALTADERRALAAFDRSREDATHPERWTALSARGS
jgi:aryl-alcohol dehydrogenase-like predicted oxidoreductase